jgi:hypothetical protein
LFPLPTCTQTSPPFFPFKQETRHDLVCSEGQKTAVVVAPTQASISSPKQETQVVAILFFLKERKQRLLPKPPPYAFAESMSHSSLFHFFFHSDTF